MGALVISAVILFGVFDSVYCGGTLLELIFGPRLGSGLRRSGKAITVSHAEQLVRENGYPFETHDCTTEDGYILTMHRLPKGRNEVTPKRSRVPVLLMHGLLGCSDMWVTEGPKKIYVAYILANAGYDVWLFNFRGNTYSRKHKTLNPNRDISYWNFSVHEMGYYDVAGGIDYILNVTKQAKLILVGHSMGGSAGLILCSTRPEYNNKIHLFINLAPVTSIKHALSPVLQLTLHTIPPITESLVNDNIYEIFPRRQYFSEILEVLCRDEATTQELCIASVFLLTGVDYPQLNSTLITAITQYYPAGTSVNVLRHHYQIYATGRFEPFLKERFARTRTSFVSNVEEYDLTKVTVPVSLHYGDADLLITKEDIRYLSRQLRNVVGIFRVAYPNFNHIDFLWAVDVKKLLYDQLLTLMNMHS